MDATSFLFILVVVLLGAPLAYFADWLGRRLGKKRLSIFGLRPRHTATLLTVSAGILIPLITVSVMLAASKGVREWVFRGADALREKQQLEEDRAKTLKELGDVNSQLIQQRRLFSEADRKAKAQIKFGKELEARGLILSHTNHELNASIERQRITLRNRESDVRRLTSQVRDRAAAVTKATAQLTSKQAELKGVNASYDKLRTAYNSLDADRTKLDRENQSLQAKIDKLGPEVDAKQRELVQAAKDLAEKQGELDQAQKSLEQAGNEYKAIQKLADDIIGPKRYNRMIYSVGSEIVRLPVAAGLSADDARIAVQSLVSLARREAAQKGAAPRNNINIADLATITDPVPMTPLEVQATLISGVTNRSQPAVLIAYTPVNVFETESVELVVDIKPNPLVYRKGQTILETSVDGRLDRAAIVEQLAILLSGQLTQKLITDQMIPRQGQDAPFGEVPIYTQMEQIVTSILHEARAVKVLVVAKEDTRASDRLQIEFRIGK